MLGSEFRKASKGKVELAPCNLEPSNEVVLLRAAVYSEAELASSLLLEELVHELEIVVLLLQFRDVVHRLVLVSFSPPYFFF